MCIKIEILLSWADSLPQHHTAAASVPSPSRIQTHTHKTIHPQKSTNILATLLHPACLEWQGQGVGDDNMAAVISFHAVPSVQSGMKQWLFPRGEVTRVWRGPLFVQSEDCWSLAALPARGHAAPLLLTDNRGGRRRDQAAHHLHPDVAVEARERQQRGNEWESQSGLDKQIGKSQRIKGRMSSLATIRRWTGTNKKKRKPKEAICVSVSVLCYSGLLSLIESLFRHTDAIPCIPDLWAASLHSKASPHTFLHG